ncbi:MAG TPA: hypothetical protein VH951_13220 [Dehalococcoidia bacterium]
MAAAVVNICVDPRLNHESLRAQVAARSAGAVLAGRVFITNEPGGNFGSSARSTIALLKRTNEPVGLAAVLHHDSCVAAAAGLRQDLAAAAKALQEALAKAGFDTAVLTGSIVTENSTILWTDQPLKSSEVLSFRMPRMYGR